MALFNYECDEIKRIIEEVSPNYPQLTTYTSEWLYFYEHEYTPGTPVDLEYQEVIVNPYGSVSNAIPYQYKRAILKGNTDENLQSVQMPVLTITGKNLFNPNAEANTTDGVYGFIKLTNNKNNSISVVEKDSTVDISNIFFGLTGNGKDAKEGFKWMQSNGNLSTATLTNSPYGYFSFFPNDKATLDKILQRYDIQFEESVNTTTYEPYKSDILTVNEDITLRSNGDVYDELNLLTGRLTQRIDENNEVLSQEIIKTVNMNKLNKPYEGTNHYQLTSNIPCEAILEVPVVSTGEQTLQEIND